jgi:hypothetical protein
MEQATEKCAVRWVETSCRGLRARRSVHKTGVMATTYMSRWDSIEKISRDAIDRWMYLDRRARSINLKCHGMFECNDVFLRRCHIHGVPTFWAGAVHSVVRM